MIKFGPSGLSEDFRETGLKTVNESVGWLKQQNVDCFEYSFGRGVTLKKDSAVITGEIFKNANIEMSVHAPYFINLATLEEDKANNNIKYIFDSLEMLNCFQGNRCVFHPGSPLKALRSDAMKVLLKSFENICKIKEENPKYKDLLLCPETMGKMAQLGDLDEVIQMCQFGESIIPCIDFGHLNSRMLGAIKAKDDYKRIIDRLIDGVGEEKTNKIHVHFSKIQYTEKGEYKHLTFDDETFGPDFEPLMEVFSDYKLNPYVVCESSGTQTRDALMMKNYFNKYNNTNK